MEALDLGADDYVTKPFAMDEPMARVRVALRRTGDEDAPVVPTVHTDDFSLDFAERRALVHGQAVRFTPTEWSPVLCAGGEARPGRARACAAVGLA